MATSRILKTVDYPIPTWKGPLENDVPEILTIEEEAPPISGASQELIDFHCAETVAKDAGIENFQKVPGTVFDDQD